MIEKITDKTIFILAPHTDDGELGCGGTIAKLCAQGNKVLYIAFSSCNNSLLKEFPPDTLKKEVKKAVAVLGIAPDNLIILDYSVREFKDNRQSILDTMIQLREQYKPDIIFLPSSQDIHQDHQVIYEEGVRAFKYVTILGYELPWNNLLFKPGLFIKLGKSEITRKAEALMEYQSQLHRPYLDKELIFSQARVRGGQLASIYAEAFEVIRMIL